MQQPSQFTSGTVSTGWTKAARMTDGDFMIFDEPLAEPQVELLRLVWRPIAEATDRGQHPDWPVWDYVERSLYRAFPTLETATDLLAALPSVPASIPRARPYGLVWHAGNVAMGPGREDRIGLTIAGLTVLARHGAATLPLADALAGIIGAAAAADVALEPNPFAAVKVEVPLSNYTTGLAIPTRERRYSFPDRLVAEGLGQDREYAPLSIHPIDAPEGHKVLLGRTVLRPYREVTTATDYLARIAVVHARHEDPVRFTSPLTLVQTLDYLSYVLTADPRWPDGLRLTATPDLQSVTALVAEVQTRSEYEAALSALWNVLDHLHVPDVPPEVIKTRFGGSRPRSIGRLRYWLEQRLGAGASLQRAIVALDTIRRVGRLRAEPQHGSTTIRQEALDARRQLGLADMVQDYHSTWAVVLNTVAGAFDTVREEVQHAAMDHSDTDLG